MPFPSVSLLTHSYSSSSPSSSSSSSSSSLSSVTSLLDAIADVIPNDIRRVSGGGEDTADVGSGRERCVHRFPASLAAGAAAFPLRREVASAHVTAEQEAEARAERERLPAEVAETAAELVAPSQVDGEVDGGVDEEEEVVELPRHLLGGGRTEQVFQAFKVLLSGSFSID